MNETEIAEFAKRLSDAHGDAAETATKAREAEEKGDAKLAEDC